MAMIAGFGWAEIPPEDEALRASVRAFLAERLAGMPSSRRARSWLGFDAAFTRDLAANGWVGLTLPKAYGGGGRGPFARFVLIEELLTAGAPVAAHWIAERQSAPLILRCGTEDQRRRLIPAICRGEAFYCAGMSEPEAGSDLASVRTRATKTADGWRLSGSKLWTTHATRAHYMVALVRTSGGSEDRGVGLSQFLVDLSLPGVTVRPIRDLAGDEHFAEVYFDEVNLTADALLGVEGEGWAQVNAELAFERSGPERLYSSAVLVDAWIAHVRRRGSPSETEQRLAGELVAELSVLRRLSLAVTGRVAAGDAPMTMASMVKDLGVTFEQSIPARVAHCLAAEDRASLEPELMATLDYVAGMAPSFSLRGGTREVLRGIIARGLGLR